MTTHVLVLLAGALALNFLTPTQSNAQLQDHSPAPLVTCPSIGEEYEQMISKLEAIKASVKDTGNCRNVVMQVDSLKKLLDEDRPKVMEIVNRGTETPLTAAQAELVKKYAEGMTTKVASLYDLFTNSNQCFQEDAQGNRLSSLASFVGEASTLVGSVSGQYGAPIALAGNLIAGFLTGLDSFNKTRAGYDFKIRSHWTNYVQNLCTYHSFQGQIEHLLNPAEQVANLMKLDSVLSSQIQKLSQVCTDCKKISETYQPGMTEEAARQAAGALVQAADSKNSTPYGSYTLQNLGLREWIKDEVSRIEREASGDWGNASGQFILGRAQQEIEDFLINREAPKFLAYQTAQAQADYREFLGFVSGEGRAVYLMLEQSNKNIISRPLARGGFSANPLDYFESLVLSPLNWQLLPDTVEAEDMQYSWNHFRMRSLMDLRSSETSARVALSFCAFFKRTHQYSSAIRATCANPQFQVLAKEFSQILLKVQQSRETRTENVSNLSEFNLEDGRDFSRTPLEALTKSIKDRRIQ